MTNKSIFLSLAFATLLSCTKIEYVNVEPIIEYETVSDTTEAGVERFTHEDVIVCNEGNWQSDNGQLSLFSTSNYSTVNKWFQSVNNFKLGDTPNDLIQVNDTLYAVAINWSNIIQYIHPDGTACGATENIPNNRKMCIDDKNNLYITSYAHECGDQKFTKGYVAKVDVDTKQIVSTCEVGWEPEGIRYYDGKLFVANTGGYSFSESHDYENTISVIDAESMTLLQNVEIVSKDAAGNDIRIINLYGEMSQAGQYLCINSPGDYYEVPATTTIFDCESLTYTVLNFPCTYNTTDGEKFYTIGSSFSYITYDYEYYINTIDPKTLEITPEIYSEEVTECIKSLTSPYEVYISPYTKNLYLTDAKSYASAGYLYAFSSDGVALTSKQKVYINPAHMIAVPHYTVDPVYTVTITTTPHISYPTTKSSNLPDINAYHRQKFVEAWSASR